MSLFFLCFSFDEGESEEGWLNRWRPHVATTPQNGEEVVLSECVIWYFGACLDDFHSSLQSECLTVSYLGRVYERNGHIISATCELRFMN